LRKLPVITIIKEALLIVWQKRLVLFRALVATAIAMAALDTSMRYGLRGVGPVSLVLLLKLLDMILSGALSTLFAVTCHRIVLLGDTSVPKYGLYSWTSRETKFFGWIVVVSLYTLLIIGPVLLGTLLFFLTDFANGHDDFAKGHEKDWMPVGAATIVMVPVFYVVARLAVLFPATAIGERRNTDWAFAITAKNGWRIVGTLFFMAPFSIGVHSLPIDPGVLSDFLMRLMGSVFMTIGVVALSLSFRFLCSTGPEVDRANSTLERDAPQAARPSP
jgi:hypothetical protein